MSEKQEEGIVITKKKLALTIVLIVALIVCAAVVGINSYNRFGPESPTQTVSTPDIDPNAGIWEGETLPSQGGVSTGIDIPGYPSITISANTTNVVMALLNPEGNPCYFTFEIVLDDTGESIYKSKLVPPGQVISKVTLSKALDVGEHNATIKITTTSLTDQTPMNGANVKTVLIAK